MTTATSFKGVTEIGRPLETELLETNLVSFFQWGALGIGAFANVTIPTEGAFGGNEHQLRMSADPSYESGQRWEGFRKDWVWETGIEYPSQPISISGVYVDGDFHSSSESGAFSHHIDYPNGAVVFETPIPLDSAVTCEFSYRTTQFVSADIPWWQEVQQDSFRIEDPAFLNSASGDWSLLAQNRIQLPAVIVESTSNFSATGKNIGGLQTVNRQEVRFHVLTEDRTDMKRWADVVRNQFDHRIRMFDAGAIADANAYAILADGSLASGAKMYPQLVQDYFWTIGRFQNVAGTGPFRSHPTLYYTTVRATLEFDN